jgi:hypothetical protein
MGQRIPGDKPPPAQPWLIAAVAYLTLMLIHPTTNTVVAGLAQIMLYLSVMAPVFWLPSLMRGPQHLGRLLVILLMCSGVNCVVGIMQVYDPARWMPPEISRVVAAYKFGNSTYTYKGSDGRLIIRPPGLFDTPGAVAGPGMIAGLLGLIFFLAPVAKWQKVLALGFSFAGAIAIYLTQVRTSILILFGMLTVYLILLTIQREKAKAIAFGSLVALLFSTTLAYAVLLGGSSISERFATLTADEPLDVYYKAGRGSQLESGFTSLLTQYPLGAGLGRWGMMRLYFGDESDRNSPSIWAELQFSAWILDGGYILMVLYCIALLITTRQQFRLARGAPHPRIRTWAAVVVAASAGTLALVFGFTPFTTQLGMQYWILAGALHGAAFYRSNPVR